MALTRHRWVLRVVTSAAGYVAGYSRSVFSDNVRIGRVPGNYYPKLSGSSNADSMATYLLPQGRHSARLAFNVRPLKPQYERVVGSDGGAGKGDLVCQYGMMTNHVQCGQVAQTRVEQPDGTGGTLTDLTEVDMDNMCSVTGGDSGGPVFVTANRGILAEGFIDLYDPDDFGCGGGNPLTQNPGEVTYYTPLHNALSHFGLQLTHANP
jgi:hypothetical protein